MPCLHEGRRLNPKNLLTFFVFSSKVKLWFSCSAFFPPFFISFFLFPCSPLPPSFKLTLLPLFLPPPHSPLRWEVSELHWSGPGLRERWVMTVVRPRRRSPPVPRQTQTHIRVFVRTSRMSEPAEREMRFFDWVHIKLGFFNAWERRFTPGPCLPAAGAAFTWRIAQIVSLLKWAGTVYGSAARKSLWWGEKRIESPKRAGHMTGVQLRVGGPTNGWTQTTVEVAVKVTRNRRRTSAGLLPKTSTKGGGGVKKDDKKEKTAPAGAEKAAEMTYVSVWKPSALRFPDQTKLEHVFLMIRQQKTFGHMTCWPGISRYWSHFLMVAVISAGRELTKLSDHWRSSQSNSHFVISSSNKN